MPYIELFRGKKGIFKFCKGNGLFALGSKVFEAAGKDNLEIDKELKMVGMEKMLSFGIFSFFIGVRALIDGIDAAKFYQMDIS